MRREFVDARSNYFQIFLDHPAADDTEDLVVYTESGILSYPAGVFAEYGEIITKTLANLK